jgi:hypothetical protein
VSKTEGHGGANPMINDSKKDNNKKMKTEVPVVLASDPPLLED